LKTKGKKARSTDENIHHNFISTTWTSTHLQRAHSLRWEPWRAVMTSVRANRRNQERVDEQGEVLDRMCSAVKHLTVLSKSSSRQTYARPDQVRKVWDTTFSGTDVITTTLKHNEEYLLEKEQSWMTMVCGRWFTCLSNMS
jgi:hypothetical protein